MFAYSLKFKHNPGEMGVSEMGEAALPAVLMTGVKEVTDNVVEFVLTAGWVKIEPGVVEGGAGAAGSAAAGSAAGAAGCCCSAGTELAVETGVVSWTGFDTVTGTVSAGGGVEVAVDVGVASGTDTV